MIRTVQREVASSSNVNAPKFNFREYVRGQVYRNNSNDIDFVTDNGNLYVPVSDNVTANKNSAVEDSNFMLLVAKGEQGEQGVKGEKGADGRTPSVYARFDGKQMVFYTNVLDDQGNLVYNDNGTPATRRIAATNDLTGPSWKPELVNDTIVWRKTKDDETPKSIPLSNLITHTAPVLLRVDSDNTRRMDEMDESGPANYIQWKYEGDEHWNNLISISELMNLTLAGVSIWFDESDGKYHFGHKEVEKASYAASHTGKQIITEVELGEILYDAGPIPWKDWTNELRALHHKICEVERKIPRDYVKKVNNIRPDEDGNVTLPNYVKTVNHNEPDENGNIDIEIPNLNEYLKVSDLKFEVRVESEGRYLYMSTNNGNSWTKILDATCICRQSNTYTVTFGIPNPSNAEMRYGNVVKYPGDTITVSDGTTICIEATAPGYQNFHECYTINGNRTISPVLIPESQPVTKYQACVIDGTGLADKIYIGISSPNLQQSCLSELNDGTTVYGKATRSGYIDKTISGTINGEDLNLYITGQWQEDTPQSEISVSPSTLNFPAVPTSTQDFCVTTNSDNYSITVGCDWLSAEKNPSNPNYVIVSVNDNTGDLRQCFVTVTTSDGEATARVKVTQAAGEGPQPTTYTVNTDINGGNCPNKPDHIYLSTTAGEFTDEYTTLDVTSGTTVYMMATREGYYDKTWSEVINNSKTVTLNDAPSCDWEQIQYTLTVNSNTPSGAGNPYITVNGTEYSGSRQIGHGDSVNISATLSGYTPTYKDGNDIITMPFDMIKNTSINIIWEQDAPTTYTVTASTGGNCTDTPDTLTISDSLNGTYRSSITFNDDGLSKTVYVRATKSGYQDKAWTVSVNGTTTIVLGATGQGDDTCTWVSIVQPCSITGFEIEPTLQLTVGGNDGYLNPNITYTGDCNIDYSNITYYVIPNNSDVISVLSRDADHYGVVVANAEGTAEIEASYNGYTSNRCVVTVVNATPSTTPITGASMDKGSVSITRTCGDAPVNTEEVTVTPTPADATVTGVVWNVGSTNVATISIKPNTDNRTVIITPGQMAGGTTTVTATITGFDSNGQSTTKTASCTVNIVDSMIINAPSLNKQGDDYLLEWGSNYTLTTTVPSGHSVTWGVDSQDGSVAVQSQSGNKGKVTTTKLGAGIVTAQNNTTKCSDNVRFWVYDKEEINIDSVNIEADGTDWINGEVCTSITGGNTTGYNLDYLIYAVSGSNVRPTSTSWEGDINLDVAVSTLNQNCEEFNIDRSNFGNNQYAYILVRDTNNNNIKAETWVRVPDPED